jgi:hypothetical protein
LGDKNRPSANFNIQHDLFLCIYDFSRRQDSFLLHWNRPGIHPLRIFNLSFSYRKSYNQQRKGHDDGKTQYGYWSFFSELGTDLLKEISSFDPDIDNIRKNLKVDMGWEEKNFSESSHIIKNYDYSIHLTEDNKNSILLLKSLKSLLLDKRQFMLGLLENPNLLEHESFTDMLWAAFHLAEELENRYNLDKLPNSDYQHLSIDLELVYSHLIYEWLHYMEHLMNNYPYLFSLALRTNPFDPDAK